MKNFAKFIAPMAVACTLLASCGGTKDRVAWTELEKSVKVYDDIIKEHRIASTQVKAHVNKFKLNGSVSYPAGGINIKDEEINMGSQDLLNIKLPVYMIDRMFNLARIKDSNREKYDSDVSISNIVAYILKLPVSDFVLLCIDGFKQDGDGYAGMKSMQWKNLVPTYSFSGSGDSKKLSNVKITISSLKNFINEVRDRIGERSALTVDGDMTVTGELNVDTNTGYIKDFSLKANSNGFKYKTSSSYAYSCDFNASIDADVKFEFNHEDADKVNIKYQTIEYNPTIVDDEFTFKNNDFKVTQYDSLAALETATGIKANWYFETSTYDDPIRKKDYFLTDSTSKNIGYEGFDYDVSFTQETGKEKYGFVLNSCYNVDTLKPVTKGGKQYKADDIAKSIKNGSSVRYNSLDISSDLTDYKDSYKYDSPAEYAASEGKTAYFTLVANAEDKSDVAQKNSVPEIHIFGSDLYNSKGTYTVTLGIYKLNLD